MTTRSLFPFFLILLLASPADAQGSHEATAQPGKSQHQDDTRTIANLLGAFYESLTFTEQGQPDWPRFRNLFVSAASPCVRIAGDSVMQMDRESFIAFFGGRIQRGALKSFAEKEVSRSVHSYGSITQVFSTYEKRMNLATDGKPIRGINSFQLYLKDGRWWIASVVWQDESASVPIPASYLK
jgi:hypothetical protein